jgi:hypothetical protein
VDWAPGWELPMVLGGTAEQNRKTAIKDSPSELLHAGGGNDQFFFFCRRVWLCCDHFLAGNESSDPFVFIGRRLATKASEWYGMVFVTS